MSGLRYLKRCFRALPFSCHAVFHSFTILLLARFFRSSAPTKSLAQSNSNIAFVEQWGWGLYFPKVGSSLEFLL